MFIRGYELGYVYYLGCKRIVRSVLCQPGRAEVVDVRGEFEEVYRIFAYTTGGSYLAGGLATHYMLQGLALVSLGATPYDLTEQRPLHVFLVIVGKSPADPPVPIWRELFLEARLAGFQSPRLAPIHAVSALDSYFETVSGRTVAGSRPAAWSRLIDAVVGQSLRDIIGKETFQELERLVQVRNKVAHGKDHTSVLPAQIGAREAAWPQKRREIGGEYKISPGAEFSLHVALHTIRECRHRIEEINPSPAPLTSDPWSFFWSA
jgi:hypothetical protein